MQNASQGDENSLDLAWLPDRTVRSCWRRQSHHGANDEDQGGVADTIMKAALATLAAAGINDGDEIEDHIRAAQDESCHQPKTLSLTWLKNNLLPPDCDEQHALFDEFDA
jgi:hypothetical protein